MSNYIANVVTNVFPIGNVIVRGVMVCMVASSLPASTQLTKDHMAPISNMTDTGNL